jgi:hypothetical protein
VAVLDECHPFVYVPDPPDGPVDLGVATQRVQSLSEAIRSARGERPEGEPADGRAEPTEDHA